MKKLKSIVANLHTVLVKEDYIYKQKYIQIPEIPRMDQIIIHSSHGTFDKKYLSIAPFAAELIGLQKSVSIRAKKAVAAFHLRKNQIVGHSLTLSKSNNFYNFFEKLIYLVYPNYREFHRLATVDSFGTCNNSFIHFSPFPETKSAYQFFDFLSGFNLSIKLTKNNNKTIGYQRKNKKTNKKMDTSYPIFFSFFPFPRVSK
jgi:ribosomal protein L5